MKVWIASSSRVKDDEYLSLARDVASFFSKRGDELLCGGLGDSMMREIFHVFEENHQSTTCITLSCYHENLERAKNKIIVDSTFERTKKLYNLADIIIFLPGGSGSLSEFFAAIEEHRTIENHKKIILYNFEGYYDSLISILGDLIRLGFNDKSILEHLEVVTSIKELEKKVSENNEPTNNGKISEFM